MTFGFGLFSKKKMNNPQLTENMQTDWLHMLDDYRDEKYTLNSDYHDFWNDLLYQYFNELPLGESTESDYTRGS